jgi:hypothetical protein
LGVTRLHYADKKAGIDYWETLALLSQTETDLQADVWSTSEPFDDCVPELDKSPEAGGSFAPLASEFSDAKSYARWTKALKDYLYRERTLAVWECPALKESSKPLETEREFRSRLVQTSREERDEHVEALRAKYTPKLATIEEQMRRATERLEREQAQASRSSWDATIALGSSVLGALLGRKTVSKTTVARATTAAKAATKAVQQRDGVSQAAGSLESLRQKYAELQLKFREEIEQLEAALRPEALVFEQRSIRPKKSDVTVERVVLAWMPHLIRAQGQPEPAY